MGDAMKTLFLGLTLIIASAHAGANLPSNAEDAWNQLVSPLSCNEECKSICCKNGGGVACIAACGCTGRCSKTVTAPGICNEECKSICCKNGGGDACVTACGCPGGCSKKINAEFEGLRMAWDGMAKGIMAGGCKKPGACGLAYQGCCFGAGHSGDACTCKLTDGSGEVGTDCSGTDKAGACGVAYTACCVAYKVKGEPCTCDVEKP